MHDNSVRGLPCGTSRMGVFYSLHWFAPHKPWYRYSKNWVSLDLSSKNVPRGPDPTVPAVPNITSGSVLAITLATAPIRWIICWPKIGPWRAPITRWTCLSSSAVRRRRVRGSPWCWNCCSGILVKSRLAFSFASWSWRSWYRDLPFPLAARPFDLPFHGCS